MRGEPGIFCHSRMTESLSKTSGVMSLGLRSQPEGAPTFSRQDTLDTDHDNHCNPLKHKYVYIYYFIMILKHQNHLVVLTWKMHIILKTDKENKVFILLIIYKLYNLKYEASFPLINEEGVTELRYQPFQCLMGLRI